MMTRDPSPGSRSLATLSRKGRGSKKGHVSLQPSPLAGEGVSPGLVPGLTGEGAKLKFAKQLRKAMTDAETKLWQLLRAKRFENYKFRRQVPVGRYIADFLCFERRLIVEVDGSQHDASPRDEVRDTWLLAQGFELLRLWNRDVLTDPNGALLTILDRLERKSP